MDLEMDTDDLDPHSKDDDGDGDINLIAKEWIMFFKNVPLSSVPWGILDIISKHFDDDNWTILAVELKVDNPQTMKEIIGDAKAQRQWTSRVLLQHCADHLPDLTFSELLVMFRNMRRTAVWTGLHRSGQVEEFMRTYGQPLKEYNAEKVIEKLDLLTDYRGAVIGQRLRQLVTAAVNVTEALSELDVGRRALKTVEPPRQNGQWKTSCITPPPSPSKDGDHKGKENGSNGDDERNNDDKRAPVLNRSLQSIKGQSPAPKNFVILLTYSEDANHLVPDLLQRLWDCRIGVISESTLQGRGYFEANHVSSWENFFRQCHLVVPIISEQYLRDIKSPTDSYQSKGVRFVFDLFTRKYVRDGCVNNKVRPLVVDDLRGQKLRGINPTLEIRWKLKEEIEGFMKILVNRKSSVLGY